jgi:hypothetical protein
VVPEEQDIDAHYNDDESDHEKRDGRVSSHSFVLGVGGSPKVARTVRYRAEGRLIARTVSIAP